MASLWKRQNSPYWVCCFTDPNGQRLKKSTKQKNRNKALQVCLQWEEAANLSRHGTFTEAQARRVISEIVEKATGEPIQSYTIEEWFHFWLEGKKQTTSQATFIRYKQVINSFLEFSGKRAKLNLGHLSAKNIKPFRDQEYAQGKSEKTCNITIKIISSALNAARRNGIIQINPAEAVDPLPLHNNGESKSIFSKDQILLLIESEPSEWRGVIFMGYYTGARLRDISDMKWDSIDLPNRVIKYIPKKTSRSGKKIVIPIHPELETYLLEMPAPHSGNEYLFPELSGKQTGGAHGLSQTFMKIIDRAGINNEIVRQREGKGRAYSKLSFHSLRHSFNSIMANKGVAQEIRQKLTGHSSADMNEIYTHHELDTLREAIEVIPSINRKK